MRSSSRAELYAVSRYSFWSGPELRRQHDVEQRNDAVQRRADFVAHSGQEFALGHHRRFGILLGLHQLALDGAKLVHLRLHFRHARARRGGGFGETRHDGRRARRHHRMPDRRIGLPAEPSTECGDDSPGEIHNASCGASTNGAHSPIAATMAMLPRTIHGAARCSVVMLIRACVRPWWH